MSKFLRQVVPLNEGPVTKHIFYPNHEGHGQSDYHDTNANKHYLKHHENLLKLRKMAKEPTSFEARHQVEKEIGIAQKKLDYWEKHPNYNHEEIKHHIAALNREHGASREERIKSKLTLSKKIQNINQQAKERNAEIMKNHPAPERKSGPAKGKLSRSGKIRAFRSE